jgi:hypothetical protein
MKSTRKVTFKDFAAVAKKRGNTVESLADEGAGQPMTPKGPRSERETVISFNEEEETATIWTASGPMDRRLRKLGLEVIEEGDRHTVFKCPRSQVKIRRQKVLSAERRASLSNRMRLARQGQAITTAKGQVGVFLKGPATHD